MGYGRQALFRRYRRHFRGLARTRASQGSGGHAKAGGDAGILAANARAFGRCAGFRRETERGDAGESEFHQVLQRRVRSGRIRPEVHPAVFQAKRAPGQVQVRQQILRVSRRHVRRDGGQRDGKTQDAVRTPGGRIPESIPRQPITETVLLPGRNAIVSVRRCSRM